MTKIPTTLSPEGKDQNLTQTMGGRFRKARALCPLSRTAFCLKYGLNSYTVQSWELDRSFSRAPNAAKFCEALAAEGITCTEDWLIEGIGPGPYLASAAQAGIYAPPITARHLRKKTTNDHGSFIQKEVALFCDHSDKMGISSVAIQVPDKAMAPDYEAGETIGALRAPLHQVHHFHQIICLIEATPHHFLIRHLLIEGETYILLATNKDYPLIRLNEVTSVAEIVWRRRMPVLGENGGVF